MSLKCCYYIRTLSYRNTLHFEPSSLYLLLGLFVLIMWSNFPLSFSLFITINHITSLKQTNLYFNIKFSLTVLLTFCFIFFVNLNLVLGGRVNLQPNLQKGGLGRISIFRGGCWERGKRPFSGRAGVQFLHKTAFITPALVTPVLILSPPKFGLTPLGAAIFATHC